ncbi:MAG TPA: CofH family radical SAM protein [Fibrobacteraceae bacterium]|nr:CofH family radical SAM protein [Fibrobacteraceae bacterium]
MPKKNQRGDARSSFYISDMPIDLLKKASQGERISPEEALILWQKAPWTSLVEIGDALRRQRLDPDRVSYTAYRLINYTNVCDIGCSFCSFQDEVASKRAYVLSLDEIRAKAEGAKAMGADQVLFQGGTHVGIPKQYYLDALNLLHHDMGMHVRGFSPIEIQRYAQNFGQTIPEFLSEMKAAGLGSVPGAGAELLTARMRKRLSPRKLSREDWCLVMGECHKAGLPGSANIVFGSNEEPEDIIGHLEAIRTQQDQTGGFLSFVPWIFQPQTRKFFVRHVTGPEYLRMVALCRIFFDNILHIEASGLVMGPELAELALHSGADDVNSYVIEENVLRSRGFQNEAAIQNFIRNAGFEPQRRTLNFDGEQP